MTDWVGGFAKLASAYPNARPAVEFRQRLAELSEQSQSDWGELFPSDVTPTRIANYLFDELTHAPKKPIASGHAAHLFAEFTNALPESDRAKLLSNVLKGEPDAIRGFILARNWVDAFLTTHLKPDEVDTDTDYRDELAWIVLSGGVETKKVMDVTIAETLDDIAGNHPRISRGVLPLHYHEMLRRVRAYRTDVVPR
ncbi:MAG: AAA family ATPase, partial [Planctomycetaceae bacterium]|nr:AAA family ATPase [Planctomycetaceae bacterium]